MLKAVFAVAALAMVLAFLAPDLAPRLVAGLSGTAVPTEERAGGAVAAPRLSLEADRSGHYQSEISVNGRTVDAMVDTGATLVVLTYEDARALGLVTPTDRYDAKVSTANGSAMTKRVTLRKVELGPILVRDVEGLVAQPGQLGVTLLGMSFLGKLGRFEVSDGRLLLEE